MANDTSTLTVSQREQMLLAPYATFTSASKGRKIPEIEHEYRGAFQRDRDRILHSSAYRRLSGKMQVFTGEMGDYHRTRLTHTQEVASIARTIARTLRLNEDLVEALALLHDIGHPPYGHAGEDVLDECMKSHGGFSHNQFALTIVEEIEHRHSGQPGLNLTYEVLAGQTDRIDKTKKGLRPSLEVQLVDAADSTTYDAHDTDDAIKLGLVSLEEMAKNRLVAECIARVKKKYTSLTEFELQKGVIRRLVDIQVTDLIHHTAEQLAIRDFQSIDEVIESDFIVEPSAEIREQKEELEKFLYAEVYRHPELMIVRQQAQRRLERMYNGFCARPELIPQKYQSRIEKVGLEKAAGHYIAGMTDRFCDRCYQLHFTPGLRS